MGSTEPQHTPNKPAVPRIGRSQLSSLKAPYYRPQETLRRCSFFGLVSALSGRTFSRFQDLGRSLRSGLVPNFPHHTLEGFPERNSPTTASKNPLPQIAISNNEPNSMIASMLSRPCRAPIYILQIQPQREFIERQCRARPVKE
jgi:hypothetical protein